MANNGKDRQGTRDTSTADEPLSWWLGLSPEEFSKKAREEQLRMQESRFGQRRSLITAGAIE